MSYKINDVILSALLLVAIYLTLLGGFNVLATQGNFDTLQPIIIALFAISIIYMSFTLYIYYYLLSDVLFWETAGIYNTQLMYVVTFIIANFIISYRLVKIITK